MRLYSLKSPYNIKVSSISESLLISCFIELFFAYRFHPLVEEILRKKYLYTNETEIKTVIDWTYRLLHDEAFVTHHLETPSFIQYLCNYIKNQINLLSDLSLINYDSLMTFQLRAFLYAKMTDLVGLAIDEVKREEEYQYYIYNLRQFVRLHKPKWDVLHIKHSRSLQFYKSNGVRFTKEELTNHIDQSPLYVLGIPRNEFQICSLLALLPEEICLYSDHVEDSYALILLNIFEERIKLYPKNQFPFL